MKPELELHSDSEFDAEEQGVKYISEEEPDQEDKSETKMSLVQKFEQTKIAKTQDGDTDIHELNLVISGYMEKTRAGVYTCKLCQKTARDRANLGKHLETHFEGLCFSCNNCPKKFRSRNSLSVHKCKFVTKTESFQD